jgi:anti-sigma-K factor RskA
MTDADLSPSDLLAAEYVLGVLTAAERANVERRMIGDADLAAQVAAWEARLTPLIDAVPSQASPAVVWRRIAAQLALAGASPRRATTWWNSVGLWRTATAMTGMAAAACAAILFVAPRWATAPSPPGGAVRNDVGLTSVALLKPQTGPAAFVVAFDQKNQRLIIAPVTAESPANRSLQLWLMPNDAAPISLGLLDASKPLILRVDQLAGPDGPKATLGVSLEPLGGAPGGQPTGPVVATGRLSPV